MQTLHSNIIVQDAIAPYYLSYKSDGIMYIHVSSEVEESVPIAMKMVEKLGKMTNRKKVPLLFNFDEFALPGKANREFWSKKEACPYSLADAFIVSSNGLRIIANFYLKINKPERPTKMFTDEESAIKWLKTFL
jgi:hypothetical protein